MSKGNIRQPSDAAQDNLYAPTNDMQRENVGPPCVNYDEQPKMATAIAQPDSTWAIMRSRKRWLVYRLEQAAGPKPAKVPYYVNGSRRSGTLDTPNDVRQLATYEQAKAALLKGGYDGTAFALGPDGFGGNWQGVDQDDIVLRGTEEIANEIPGYKEYSPSRKGQHTIGYGRDFKTLGSNGTGIEAYAKGRFFTVTEEIIQDGPLTCLASYVEQKLKAAHAGGQSSNPCHQVPVQTVLPTTVSELRSALRMLCADGYQQWVYVGIALSCLGDVGRSLWMDWSSTSEKFNEAEADRKWKTFKPGDLSYETVFHMAQKNGWVNPKSNDAKIQLDLSSNSIQIDTEAANIMDIEYFDDPMIPKGQAIGFYGRGGSAKSTLVSTLAAKNSVNYSTLWITSEESPDCIKLRHLYNGGVENTIAVVRDGDFDVYTHLESVVKQAKEKLFKPLGFVVLDAVVALVNWKKGESANDDGAVKRLINFIDQLAQSEGVSILMIGHLNKGKGHEHIADAVLGATAWTNSVRLAYILQKLPEEDSTGFIRTAKSNMNTHFGVLYQTIPVYYMSENIDGYRPVLCKVEFICERIYGEKNLAMLMAEDDEYEVKKKQEKEQKIKKLVETAVHALKDGLPKTREIIEASFGATTVSRRNWVLIDEHLKDIGIQITSGERNRRYYQLPPAPHP